MKESLYTIPLSVAFEKADGCPFCYLYQKTESDEISRALGPALMQPEMRVLTNEQGFCKEHLEKLHSGQNTLGLALMLSTHLETISETLKKIKEQANTKKNIFKKSEIEYGKMLLQNVQDCCICKKNEYHMGRYMEIYVAIWQEYKEKGQFICLEHLTKLLDIAEKKHSEQNKTLFINYHAEMAEKKLRHCHEDLCKFIKMFDHNHANLKETVNRAAIEETSAFLRGKETNFIK